MLLDMCIILYFLPFLYMFAALPVLRAKAKGANEGVSLVPGGTVGGRITVTAAHAAEDVDALLEATAELSRLDRGAA